MRKLQNQFDGKAVRFLLSGVALLASLPVLAVTAQSAEPWSERVIQSRPDLALGGVLTADQLKQLTEYGEHLFVGKFTVGDGVGRPLATQAIVPTKRKRAPESPFNRLAGMDSNACGSCHREPKPGGAGDFSVNVFVSEGFTNAEFDTSDPQFSNERNTNHVFGSGLIELLAREMTVTLQEQRAAALKKARASGEPVTAELSAKGVGFGTITAAPDGIVDLSRLDGVDTDLVIRPFSQKGVITSLRQFTINALNQHHGIEAVERFGARWTGENDFDGDGVADEASPVDVSALVAWQATRPPPQTLVPDGAQWKQMAARGDALFDTFQCSSCHMRALPLESLRFEDPGPVDAAGTLREGENGSGNVYDLSQFDWAKKLPRDAQGNVLVPLFGDLKRHRIADPQVATLGNELLSQRFVDRDVFQTTELWGIASTAPYGHRGDMTTLDEVIRAHGGEGRSSHDAYVAAGEADREALIAFLKTLVIQ